MVDLNMSLDDFYGYTPCEIALALTIYNKRQEDKIKNEWEMTRVHIYYHYLLTPSKNHKVTYEYFKKQYLSLGFDEATEDTIKIDDETFLEIHNIFNELNQKEATT